MKSMKYFEKITFHLMLKLYANFTGEKEAVRDVHAPTITLFIEGNQSSINRVFGYSFVLM